MKYVLAVSLFLFGCTYNVDYVKEKAPEVFKTNGFEIVGYEGYQGFMSHCGGRVWYLIKRPESPTIYHAYLCKWGDEIHIYNLESINSLEAVRK